MTGAAGAGTAVVVMGVSGCGKSTTARLLAERLAVPFVEGDTLHPPSNRAKMARGQRLTDADRLPWLRQVAEEIDARHGRLVVSCSALKTRYRDILRAAAAPVVFVHLCLDEVTAGRRVARRSGHFMPARLVASQFEDLEPLTDAEGGVRVDACATVPDVVEAAMRGIRTLAPPGTVAQAHRAAV